MATTKAKKEYGIQFKTLTQAQDMNFKVTLSRGCFILYDDFPATNITENKQYICIEKFQVNKCGI